MAHLSPSATASAAAINKRAKQLTEPLFKKSPVFAIAQQKGTMEYNCGGNNIEWPVRYRRRTITAGGSPLAVTYPEFNRLTTAVVPYRVYELGEGISKFTQYAVSNESTSYLANAFDSHMKWTLEDFMVDLSRRIYTDGAASGSLDMYGLESLFNATAVATNARVGTPAGTYAGVSEVLAAFGGSWTAETSEAWPTGWGTDQYRFWSPYEVDYTSAKWTTSTWAGGWQEQVAWVLAMMEAHNGERPDAVLLTPHMYWQARNSVLNNQRFELTQNKDMIEAGVKAMQVEGIDFITDGRIAQSAGAGIGYIVTFDKLRICCMGSQLIETDQDFDLTTKNRQWALDSHLNTAYESPAYFGKLLSLT